MRDDRDNTEREQAALASIGVVLVCSLLLALALAMCGTGCAHYTVDRETGEGSSYGFLRSMSVERETIIEFRADGSRVETCREKIVTTSNTADILMGANELLGTVVDGAAKAMP